ncbi:MAG TPA: hypothetical protein VLA77_01110 [Candidatus Saccharimonadales bacterium]|nr:hypothetical protein [Candidatus Saccharimonadales bacterium]
METEIKPTNKNDLGWLSWLVVGVVVVASAVLAWWQYSQIQSLQNQLAQKQTALDTAETDLPLTELNGVIEPDNPDAPVSTNNDTAQILSVTDAYVRAPVAAESEKFEYTIADKTGDFAKVNVKLSEGGGYYLVLKKVGDQWTVLFGGQDVPTEEMAQKYGLPAGYY